MMKFCYQHDAAIDTRTLYGKACFEAPELQLKFGLLPMIANVAYFML